MRIIKWEFKKGRFISEANLQAGRAQQGCGVKSVNVAVNNPVT